MKICVVGHQDAEQEKVLSLLRTRGSEIVVGDNKRLPPADVYFCAAITKPLKTVSRGIVVLDLRDGIPTSASDAIYADICLVHNEANRLLLIEEYKCEPGRVFVTANEHKALEIIDSGIQDTLSPAPVVPSNNRVKIMDIQTPELAIAQMRGQLKAIEQQADVMLHNYQVHSGVPVIGVFIAWLRRNLTSHLREPYIDPTLKRQVAFNTQMAQALQELLSMQADLLEKIEQLERVISAEHYGRE